MESLDHLTHLDHLEHLSISAGFSRLYLGPLFQANPDQRLLSGLCVQL
jgi:hypothetical protein